MKLLSGFFYNLIRFPKAWTEFFKQCSSEVKPRSVVGTYVPPYFTKDNFDHFLRSVIFKIYHSINCSITQYLYY